VRISWNSYNYKGVTKGKIFIVFWDCKIMRDRVSEGLQKVNLEKRSNSCFVTPEELKEAIGLNDVQLKRAQMYYKRLAKGKKGNGKILDSPDFWREIISYVLPKHVCASWEEFLGRAIGCKEKKYRSFWDGEPYKENMVLERELRENGFNGFK